MSKRRSSKPIRKRNDEHSDHLWFWVMIVFLAWVLLQCVVAIGVGMARGA